VKLTAVSFEAARSAFEIAWRAFLSKRTDADFEAWREHQAWTAEKYRRFDRGERMPPDWRSVQQTNLIQ
jgi:Ni/Co efflux regulator RcnB